MEVYPVVKNIYGPDPYNSNFSKIIKIFSTMEKAVAFIDSYDFGEKYANVHAGSFSEYEYHREAVDDNDGMVITLFVYKIPYEIE